MDERRRAAHAQYRREEWEQYRREHFRATLDPIEEPYGPEPGELRLRLSYNGGQQWPVVATLTVQEQRAVLLLLLEAEHRRLDREDVAMDQVMTALRQQMEG